MIPLSHLSALASAVDWGSLARRLTQSGVYQARTVLLLSLTTTMMPLVEKYAKEKIAKVRQDFDTNVVGALIRELQNSRTEFDREIVAPMLAEIDRLRNMNEALIRESDALLRTRTYTADEKPLVAEFYTDVSAESDIAGRRWRRHPYSEQPAASHDPKKTQTREII